MIEKKLHKQTLQKGVFVKEELSWVMACLSALRDLPTFDLYSVLHKGFLQRLREKKESLVADYLGPEGKAIYTQAWTLAEFQEKYNVVAIETDRNASMLYSPHWQGLSGIVPGTACGDEPQEAMHSPWEKQLEILGKSAEGAEVLATMQELYKHKWNDQFEWESSDPIHLKAQDEDPSMLNGASLTDQVLRSIRPQPRMSGRSGASQCCQEV